MRRLFFILACLLSFAAPLQARDILPLAHNHHSVFIPTDRTAVPIPRGARVELIGVPDGGVPKPLEVEGFVLGSLNDFIVVEVTLRDAAHVARIQATQSIRVRKTEDPDEGLVNDRLDYAATPRPLMVAPHFRTVSVEVAVPPSDVEAWATGQFLLFPKAGTEKYRLWNNPERRYDTRPKDIRGIFVRIDSRNGNVTTISIQLAHSDALQLIKASGKGALRVATEKTRYEEEVERRKRCYIRHRKGEVAFSIEIPCSN